MLYGTTYSGGITNEDNWDGLGTVFKLAKDGGGYAVLRSFTSTGEDGSRPNGLMEGSDGVLYGTTEFGGTYPYEWGGSIFKLNKNGSGYGLLKRFWSSQDKAAFPNASLVEGSHGALYGTDSCHGRCFVNSVFRISKDGSGYMELHCFSPYAYGDCGSRTNRDGFGPNSLTEGRDGALCGTTSRGGDLGLGTIFVLRPQPLLFSPVVSNDRVVVRFTSVPGSTNQLQRASTLDGSWLTLTNVVAPTNGVAEFTDIAPPQASAFYRVVQVW